MLAVAAAPATARKPRLDELVDRVQTAYDGLDSLEADFVQRLESVALGAPQEESGRLFLQRPGRMRWEYVEPEEKLAVVDGERSWLYIPAENQAILGTMAEVTDSGAAGLLLAGRVDLRRDFRIERLDGPEAAGQAGLRLVPREPTEEFASIDLTVGLDDLLPVRIVVRGQLGDVMEYRLRNVRTGVPLDPDLFRFEPPPGVDLVLAE